MHRLLAAQAESVERRPQRPKNSYPVPRPQARGPNEVWTWDITKLATRSRGVFLSLYAVLDVFSRYGVACMVATQENSALAEQLLAEDVARYDIAPSRLCVHQDRGAPMTANGFHALLGEMGVEHGHSRLRVSNDNHYSEWQSSRGSAAGIRVDSPWISPRRATVWAARGQAAQLAKPM